MGAAWQDHPSWELVEDASDAADRDIAHLLLTAGADELRQTHNAQLATFTLSLVALDAVERLGLEPACCAGHSLGEYTALVASGAISFEEGVRLVAERGEAMQHAADERPGSMSALLGLDDDAADAACRRAEADVWVANYNAPGQVVIAGQKEDVDNASAVAKELGAKRAMPLPVGGAFHTPLMEPARNRLRKALTATTFRDPEVPVTANVDARPHCDGGEWPSLLSAQLCNPVRWRQTVAQLAGFGVTQVVEVGPGGVLTGLARRCAPDLQAVSVAAPQDLDDLVAILAGTSFREYADTHQGEHLYISERLVLSPAAGLFTPIVVTTEAAAVEATPTVVDVGAVDVAIDVGALIGNVGGAEVRSPFAGWLMGLLAVDGERVSVGQPVAWLRATGGD